MGIDFNLYISKKTYDSWMNLLRGLVYAKERECRKWRHSRARHRTPRHAQPMSAAPVRTYRWRCQSTSHRARSTSPEQPIHARTFPSSCHVIQTPPHPVLSPVPSGLKRSAAVAFSPTSGSFNELPPLKRPTGMTLHIPESSYPTAPHSSSPLESLQSFSKMSLSSSSPHSSRSAQSGQSHSSIRPQTLVAPYSAEGPMNVPQVCPFCMIHMIHLTFVVEPLLLLACWIIYGQCSSSRKGARQGPIAVLSTSASASSLLSATILRAYGYSVRVCQPLRITCQRASRASSSPSRCCLVSEACTTIFLWRKFAITSPEGKRSPIGSFCQCRSPWCSILFSF